MGPGAAISETQDYPKWDAWDLVRWRWLPERIGGDRNSLRNYKNGWVQHNRQTIAAEAARAQIPAELLAAVAWIKVGGDPNFIDSVAYRVRSFDWSGPDFVDRNLTITHRQKRTSFGSVSMQLRTAAETLGMNTRKMTGDDWDRLANMLQNDPRTSSSSPPTCASWPCRTSPAPTSAASRASRSRSSVRATVAAEG